MEQHVAVAQQNAIVMVVWMTDFPQYLAVPVGFQDHASLEWKAAQEILLRGTPVVEQRPTLCEKARHAWRIRHLPGMDDVALKIDEVHCSIFHKVRGKESEPRRGAFLI